MQAEGVSNEEDFCAIAGCVISAESHELMISIDFLHRA